MDIVLVKWYIKADNVTDFFTFRRPVEPGTPGFIREDLYQANSQEQPDVLRFVNIGRWGKRQDFETKFGADVTSQEDFEVRKREREWLVPMQNYE